MYHGLFTSQGGIYLLGVQGPTLPCLPSCISPEGKGAKTETGAVASVLCTARLPTCCWALHSMAQEVLLRINVKVPQVYETEKEYSRTDITLIIVSLYQIFPAMQPLIESEGRDPSLREIIKNRKMNF